MAEFAAEAARLGARIVLYPELIVTGYIDPDRIAKLAEPLTGPSVQSLAATAERLDVALAFGFAGRAPDGSIRNSLVFVGSNGEVAGVYRKVHLWDTEKTWALPGESTTVLWMEGVRACGWICYDTRFPELARSQALAGMELALVATAWLGHGEEWELALRAAKPAKPRPLDRPSPRAYTAQDDTAGSRDRSRTRVRYPRYRWPPGTHYRRTCSPRNPAHAGGRIGSGL